MVATRCAHQCPGRWPLWLFAFAALGVLAACAPESTVGALRRCTLGAYATESGASDQQALEHLEQLAGRKMAVHRRFMRWDDSFPDAVVSWTVAQGRVPAITLSGKRGSNLPAIRWAEVADANNSEVQQQLAQLADAMATLDAPLLLSYHAEPEKDPGFGTAEEYIAAWRRLVSVFRQRGATKVQFVWSPGSSAFPGRADQWYPGDDVVDWIGVTGFNWYTGGNESPWRSFGAIFLPFHDWATGRGKPLAIVSFSSAENPASPSGPRSKAEWTALALQSLKQWPEVQLAIFYHGPGEDAVRNWAADSTPESLQAFQAFAAAPYFQTDGSGRVEGLSW